MGTYRPTPMSPVKNMAEAVAGVAVARVRPRAVLRSCQCALPRTELRANEEDALRRWIGGRRLEVGGKWEEKKQSVHECRQGSLRGREVGRQRSR